MSSAIIFAGVGAAVAIAGTAYSIKSSQDAIGAANSLKQPEFHKLKINKANQLVKASNRAFVDTSRADFEKRFPELAAGRTYNMEQSASDLAGGTAPQVNQALSQAGIKANVGGNPFQQASNLGLPILAKEQRDRSYFQNLFAKNPEPYVGGLTGPQVAQISALNTNSQYAFDLGTFGQRINQYNNNIQNQAQITSGIVGGISGLANIGTNVYLGRQDQNQYNSYLNSDYYRPPTTTLPGGGAT